jgi:hypothetical protein
VAPPALEVAPPIAEVPVIDTPVAEGWSLTSVAIAIVSLSDFVPKA